MLMSPCSPLVLLVALAGPGWADPPAPDAKEIAPLVGENVAAVVRLDVMKLDIEALARKLLSGVVDKGDREEADQRAAAAGRWFAALRAAGAKRVYVLIDPTDFHAQPTAVVPLSDGVDAAAIARLLSKGREPSRLTWPAVATINNAVVASKAAGLEQMKALKAPDRPDLAAALAAGGDAPAVVALSLGEGLRRSLEEALPMLPAEFGGGPITPLARGLRWATLGLQTAPKPALHLIVQAADADAAKALEKLGGDVLTLAAKQPALADIVKELIRTKPEAHGTQVTCDLDIEKLSALVGVPARGSRENARKSQCINNLKMLALAMHNYHSEHNTFPPAFSRDKQGKPLLSWRVAVLPYLDAKPLYDQFHLDEPWDSPHNKALISKMPRSYACPTSSPALAASGKTTYLTPRGKATMFPGGEGVKIQDVTDGTSMTLMVLDVPDDRAVIWTKPDDWETGDAPSKDVLSGKHPTGNPAAFGDGSVRSFSNAKKFTDATFRALLTRNGGEVIDRDDL
jgi:Protein of unknown function (DUF1559)